MDAKSENDLKIELEEAKIEKFKNIIKSLSVVVVKEQLIRIL